MAGFSMRNYAEIGCLTLLGVTLTVYIANCNHQSERDVSGFERVCLNPSENVLSVLHMDGAESAKPSGYLFLSSYDGDRSFNSSSFYHFNGKISCSNANMAEPETLSSLMYEKHPVFSSVKSYVSSGNIWGVQWFTSFQLPFFKRMVRGMVCRISYGFFLPSCETRAGPFLFS